MGTEYHWYVLAHQNVRKVNANDYTTSMTGLKFKIAHKRADSEKWSATPKTQRKRMIAFLRHVISDLEKGPVEAEATEAAATAPERPKPWRRGVAAPPSMMKRTRRRRKARASR